jgi:hydrogenase maturation protease
MVLGLGNVLNSDDGLGFYAIRDLAREEWPGEVCFAHRTEFEWRPLFFEGCRGLLLLDTVCRGNEPGTVYTCGHAELHRHRDCLRSPWILDAIAFSSVFGEELSTQFVGMEPGCRECRICLTPAVCHCYQDFLQAARDTLRTMLDRLCSPAVAEPLQCGTPFPAR